MTENGWRKDHWKRQIQVIGRPGCFKLLKILRIKVGVGLESMSMSQELKHVREEV